MIQYTFSNGLIPAPNSDHSGVPRHEELLGPEILAALLILVFRIRLHPWKMLNARRCEPGGEAFQVLYPNFSWYKENLESRILGGSPEEKAFPCAKVLDPHSLVIHLITLAPTCRAKSSENLCRKLSKYFFRRFTSWSVVLIKRKLGSHFSTLLKADDLNLFYMRQVKKYIFS